MTEIMTLDELQKSIKDNKYVVVDFYATWCGPCKAMAPMLEDLSSEYTGRVIFGKVDADLNIEVSKRLQIRNVPTILLYKDGTVVEKIVGMSNKEKIKTSIDKHIN